MKIIDENGKLFKKFNLFDLLAVILVLLLIIFGISFYFQVQSAKNNKIQEELKLQEEKKQAEIEKQKNNLKFLQTKTLYFSIENIDQEKLGLLKPGVKDSSGYAELIQVFHQHSSLDFISKDSKTFISKYQKNSQKKNVIVKIKMKLFYYNPDSIYFDHQKFVHKGNINFVFKDSSFVFSQVEFDPDIYVIEDQYLIKNIHERLIDQKIIEPGTNIYNQYGQKLCQIIDIHSVSRHKYEDFLNKKKYQIESLHTYDVIAKTKIFFYLINDQYYLNFHPFNDLIEGYIDIGNDQFIRAELELYQFKEYKSEFSQIVVNGQAVIHNLTSKEIKSLKKNSLIMGGQGQKIGEICQIHSHRINDFILTDDIIKEQLSLESNPHKKKILCKCRFYCEFKNGNYYFNNQLLSSYSNNPIARLIYNIETKNIAKETKVFFTNLNNRIKERFYIRLTYDSQLGDERQILDMETGLLNGGNVIDKKGNIYTVDLLVNRYGDNLYYQNKIIYYQKTNKNPYQLLLKKNNEIYVENFSFIDPDQMVGYQDLSNVEIIIHGLTKDEIKNITLGNLVNQEQFYCGKLIELDQDYQRDFLLSDYYKKYYNIKIPYQENLYKIKCYAKMNFEVSLYGLKFQNKYFNRYEDFEFEVLRIPIGWQTFEKNVEFIIGNMPEGLKYKCKLRLPESNLFSGQELINPVNRYDKIGKITNKIDKNDYLADISLVEHSNFYTQTSFIHIDSVYQFLLLNKEYANYLSGSFIPETAVRLTIETNQNLNILSEGVEGIGHYKNQMRIDKISRNGQQKMINIIAQIYYINENHIFLTDQRDLLHKNQLIEIETNITGFKIQGILREIEILK